MSNNNRSGKVGCLVFAILVIGSFLFWFYSIAIEVCGGFWNATKFLGIILAIGIPLILFFVLGAPYSFIGFWRK